MPQDPPADAPEDEEGDGSAVSEDAPDEAALEASSAAESSAALAEAIEPPPDSAAAEVYLRRAHLAEDRLAEVLGAYRKLKKENEGHRDRITRNMERRYDQRRERLLLKFIDILDNLDRALEAAESSYAGEALIQGLILVRTQLLQTLQEEGLERIPVIGAPYDPNFSEAVETVEVEDPDHHQLVVKELMRGYRLNGRIARASRVVVGHYPGPGASLEPKAETEHLTPPRTPRANEAQTPSPAPEGEPSLEEIVSRAEAQEALFPTAFLDKPDTDRSGEG